MRLFIITGLLLLQFFAARAGEAGKGARPRSGAPEARFYATAPGGGAAACSAPAVSRIKTATALRLQAPTGSLPGEAFTPVSRALGGEHTPLPKGEVHGIPISLRLLFPGHYFW